MYSFRTFLRYTLFTLLTLLPTIALAAASTYDLISPIGGMTTGVDIVTYLQKIIVVTIGVAGVLAVVMLVICGIKVMMSGSASGKSAAKECLWNALFGLLITIAAWALLYTINPDLLKNDATLADVPTPAASAGSPSSGAVAGVTFSWAAGPGCPKARGTISSVAAPGSCPSGGTGVCCSIIEVPVSPLLPPPPVTAPVYSWIAPRPSTRPSAPPVPAPVSCTGVPVPAAIADLDIESGAGGGVTSVTPDSAFDSYAVKAYRFTTTPGKYGDARFEFEDTASAVGYFYPKVVAISKCPGDFRGIGVTPGRDLPCYVVNATAGGGISYQVGATAAGAPSLCELNPGTQYYFNVKNEERDSAMKYFLMTLPAVGTVPPPPVPRPVAKCSPSTGASIGTFNMTGTTLNITETGTIGAGATMAFPFVLDSADYPFGVNFEIEPGYSSGSYNMKDISVSSCPGVFTGLTSSCVKLSVVSSRIGTAPVGTATLCEVTPGKTYYFNMRATPSLDAAAYINAYRR